MNKILAPCIEGTRVMMTMQNAKSTLSLGARLLTVGALLALFMAAWLFS
jgi:hypothetical protein